MHRFGCMRHTHYSKHDAESNELPWKVKGHGKALPQTVGHILHEISRLICFLKYEKVCGKVADEKYRP